MTDDDILARVTALVEREHQLRERHATSPREGEGDRAELHAAEVELDQCWDLLRQRRAKREFGADPEGATVRTRAVVEEYLQ